LTAFVLTTNHNISEKMYKNTDKLNLRKTNWPQFKTKHSKHNEKNKTINKALTNWWKVMIFHTRYRTLGQELIPVYRQSASRWLLKSSPAVDCHYFQPGLWSPSLPKNVTLLRPVPSYTASWHIGVNNLPKVVMQLGGNWTHDLLIANPLPYRYTTTPQQNGE